MDIVTFSLNQLPPKEEGLSLALGEFDGFHRGHQSLLLEARMHAEGKSGVLLFSNPPHSFFRSDTKKESLSSLEDKIVFARKMGIDKCYIVETDEEFFALEKEEFIEKILLPLGTSLVVVGEDFSFGRNAKGKPSDLQKQIKTIVVPLLKEGGEKVSSSRVRELIKEGKIEEATSLLGHPYQIKGKVAHGLGNGHKLGFPTMNLKLDFSYLLPKDGVYYGKAYLLGFPYKAMINVGNNPTIGENIEKRIEVHLLGYEGDGYGKSLYLEFDSFVREEKRFASLEELSAQLSLDKANLENR